MTSDGARGTGFATASRRGRREVVVQRAGRAFLHGRLSQPVLRSAYTLTIGSGLTALCGIGFWVLAARWYSPRVVGSNAAAVSAVMFLSGVAQLNLTNVLVRFMPGAGRNARRMLHASYALAAVVTALAAICFVAGVRWWAPGLRPLLSQPTIAVSFVGGAVLWTLFSLMGSALVGLGSVGRATMYNQVFNVLKLALLIPLAAGFSHTGLWVSWLVAVAVAAVAGNAVLYFKVLPQHATPAPLPGTHEVLHYAIPDLGAGWAWIAATTLVPVIVLNHTSEADSAVYSLTWAACLVLHSVPAAFGQSLVAHTAAEPDQLDRRHRTIARSCLGLMVPVVAVVAVGAPWILQVFGPWYHAHGIGTLRLLSLAAIPNVITALAVSRARVARRMRLVTVSMVALCVLTLGLTGSLVPRYGVIGAAWAWFTAQLCVASGVLVTEARRNRGRPAHSGRLDHAVRTVAARHGVTIGQVLPTVTDSYVAYVDAAHGPAVLKAAITGSGQRSLRQEVNVLLDLGAQPGMAGSGLLPTVLEEWHSGGRVQLTAMLLRRVEGRPAPADLPLGQVAAAIAALHESEPLCGDEAKIAVTTWVAQRCNTIREIYPRRAPAVDTLQCRLTDDLRSAPVVLGRVHGDYHPGNVLVDEQGAVCGIIDWGQSEVAGPPVADLAHWLLASARNTGGIGAQLARRLRQEQACTPEEELYLNSVPGGLRIRPSTALLLGWLMHVESNVTKSSRYAASPVWRWRVIRPVLAVVDRA